MKSSGITHVLHNTNEMGPESEREIERTARIVCTKRYNRNISSAHRPVFDGVAVDVNSLFCKQTQLALARSRYTPRGVHFNI